MFALKHCAYSPWILLCVLWGSPAAYTAARAPWSTQAQVNAPLREQALRGAQRPMKLDVRPLAQAPRVGDKTAVEVTMLDAANQPASWNRPCQVEVTVTGPSGHSQTYPVTVAPHQSSVQFTFDAKEPGLHRLKVRETDGTLLSGGNSVFVRPAGNTQKKKTIKPTAFRYLLPVRGPHLLTVSARPQEQLVSFATPPVPAQEPSGAQSAAASSSPALLLTNSSGKDEILADGKDFARIQVYYMDPQGGAASSDIRVWLTWSNGTLDSQPLVIKKGAIVAEAHWTSLSPVDATISFVSSAPKYPVDGKTDLTVSFVPAIYGIGVPGSSPLKLSLIDCEPVFAQFFDAEGRVVQTNKLRQVTFISSNPSLHLDPPSQDVPANGYAASTFLVPTWSGMANLDIWTPGYAHQTIVVQVSMWLVLLLCLSGGIVGGIAAWDALKGAIAGRIFVGILGAIVLVWISVYAVLPRTHSIIAHNMVSVFVLSIIGGFGGTRVLDFAGKKFGYF